MESTPCVYILANKPHGVLYIGVTSHLEGRMWQHRNGVISGFSKRYGIDKLVYYEVTECMYAAVSREKQLKRWRRAWKVELIENNNPDWEDLYPTLLA